MRKRNVNQSETETFKISVLTIPVYYSFDAAIIREAGAGYRLIVKDKNKKKPILDEYYKTARGAKIAFLKYFKYRLKTSAETDKAKKIRKDKREWTPAFYPDKGWLFQKFGLLSPLMQSNAFRTFRIVQRGFRLMVNSKYMAPPHRKGGPSRRVAARKPPVPRYHYGVTAKVRI